jgi:hypothetical protein
MGIPIQYRLANQTCSLISIRGWTSYNKLWFWIQFDGRDLRSIENGTFVTISKLNTLTSINWPHEHLNWWMKQLLFRMTFQPLIYYFTRAREWEHSPLLFHRICRKSWTAKMPVLGRGHFSFRHFSYRSHKISELKMFPNRMEERLIFKCFFKLL